MAKKITRKTKTEHKASYMSFDFSNNLKTNSNNNLNN
jgi:hypothetical protein